MGVVQTKGSTSTHLSLGAGSFPPCRVSSSSQATLGYGGIESSLGRDGNRESLAAPRVGESNASLPFSLLYLVLLPNYPSSQHIGWRTMSRQSWKEMGTIPTIRPESPLFRRRTPELKGSCHIAYGNKKW